jgi:hypothetical protein
MKQRVVIFGGPDRCGKTTIANELSRQTGIPYFKPSNQGHFARNDPGVFQLQTQWGEPKLFDFIKQTKHSVIMDRGFPCDYAYSKVLKRNTAWSMIDTLDQAYGEIGALFVVTVRRDYSGRFDDQWDRIKEDTLRELDSEYRLYAGRTHMRSIVLETDEQDLKKQIEAITLYL